MTILSKRNQLSLSVNNDGNVIWFNFMEDMIAQGWRVLGSGDGVSFENQGQKVLGASNGRMVVPVKSSLVDGETFTLDDGSAPVTFEFDTVPDGVTGGNVVVDISAATTEFEVRDVIIAAINGSSLGITAVAGWRRQPTNGSWGDPLNTAAIVLMNDTTGAGGNTASSETVANTSFTVTDMTGGGIAAGGSGGAYHLFTNAPSPVLPSSGWVSGDWGNYVPFSTFSGASWVRFATPGDADHYAEFLFQVSFDSNPGTGEYLLVAMCRGAQRFDQGADQWQRPGVNTGVAIRPDGGIYQDDPEAHSSHGILVIAVESGDSYNHWFVGDKSVDYDFLYWSTRADTQNMNTQFGRFRLAGGRARSDGSADPDPYVLLCSDLGSQTNSRMFLPSAIGSPYRYEDRVTSGNSSGIVASYGIDDPAVPADVQGHYGAAFTRPQQSSGVSTFYWSEMGSNPATLRRTIDTSPGVGISLAPTSNTPFHFHKGILKNDLIGLVSGKAPDINRMMPKVMKGPSPSDPFYVQVDKWAFYWGAEERVLP